MDKKCKNCKKCESCIHRTRDEILTDLIQNLLRWGFYSKTKKETGEKTKHPVWDNVEAAGPSRQEDASRQDTEQKD